MNILFVSNLTGKLWAGPNHSVPAQVLAQSKIDNVMWVNLNHICLPQWKRDEYAFQNYDDIKDCLLKDLPTPFNKPDFIIFEEVYSFSPFNHMVKNILKSSIPYSIIPRCSLTALAQHRHRLKKVIGNKLFYNDFVKNSHFIQYLTHQEKEESQNTILHSSVVIPNGTYIPNYNKNTFCENGINGTYIGRLEIDQKGLDLLVGALSKIKETLRSVNFTINLYGPDIDNTVEKLKTIISNNKIQDIVNICGGVFGAEKESVLKSTDIFIMTSRYEGMPMGLIEALSYGVPCIVTEGTFLMDEIIQFDAGWSGGASVNDISDAILNMISEKELLQIKSMNAKKLASQYSWSHLAEILHNHIAKVIKPKQ